MKAKSCLVAAALVLSSPVLAQEPLATTDKEIQQSAQAGKPAVVVLSDMTAVEDGKKVVNPLGLTVDELEQMDVYDAAGKKIGEVDVVLQDKGGEIRGIAVGYGGFLGFGEKGAVVTFDQVQLKDGTLVTEFDEAQLSQLPEWLKK